MTADTNDAVAPEPPAPEGAADRDEAADADRTRWRPRSRQFDQRHRRCCNVERDDSCSRRRNDSRPTSRTTGSVCCASRPRWSSGPTEGLLEAAAAGARQLRAGVASLESAGGDVETDLESSRRVIELAFAQLLRRARTRRARSASRPTVRRSIPNEHEAVMQDERRRRAARRRGAADRLEVEGPRAAAGDGEGVACWVSRGPRRGGPGRGP